MGEAKHPVSDRQQASQPSSLVIIIPRARGCDQRVYTGRPRGALVLLMRALSVLHGDDDAGAVGSRLPRVSRIHAEHLRPDRNVGIDCWLICTNKREWVSCKELG